ncbi:ER-golgi trafficking TRAPP I complex 85 kDa subunit-domain-containing protein [Calycina marina]|uniref:ER-golgi trafficking TRAPP I complex 85 kDa subunit-domain-containing protein n=1 Tax=Calycina marina TaxID=1763456 RepID=A0A9P7Z1P6_9HELO|nr:ER-golgi trafficking TRAPP I complex 85 kDa subunit-domain-containing protein [Calycina marina]
MTTNNGSPMGSPSPLGAPSLRLPKTRTGDPTSIASSISTLPYRASNASASTLFASTTTPSASRSVSPNETATPRMQSSVFGGVGTPGDNQLAPAENAENTRNLILKAFVPHIAVHCSEDTHELVKDKGFDGGLWELLRPFGECIKGKVTVRNSMGGDRAWDDFAVRFVQLGDGLEAPDTRRSGGDRGQSVAGKIVSDALAAKRIRTGGELSHIETLVDRHLSHAEEYPSMNSEDYLNFKESKAQNIEIPSPFYILFLRRILSGLPLAPHETFAHPVTCIIAISSRNPAPIEALRSLYNDTNQGGNNLPVWVNNEFLRYYVLVHDEERDDISKSIALFDQMKRHFGVNCHLLRLRSSHCISSDDDSARLPRSEWIAASEELAEIQAREVQEDFEESQPCIYESDTTAIKTFIREMVAGSVIPAMERNILVWNDQVASRRRGISGKFLNLSRKWTGFSSSSRASSSTGSASGSKSSYNSVHGFYLPAADEAVMRKLADYAFMLRDWKLAHSTYDLLRSDFNSDKAWKYYAAANEMAAISVLMNSSSINAKVRYETVDQMLETASYSYLTRCTTPYGALRALALGMELLRLRGGSAIDDAARWGAKILESKVVGPVGEALIKERISGCHASKKGSGSGNWGSRNRKSALWSVLAADAWLTLGKTQQAKLRLDYAAAKYNDFAWKNGLEQWNMANFFLQGLQREVVMALYPESGIEGTLLPDDIETENVEESKAFESRPHRKSWLGGQAPVLTGLDNAPLLGMEESEERGEVDIQFE